MKGAIAVLAFLSSVASLVILTGGGLALLLIRNSGERGTGALFAICGAVAFASVMALIFAREEKFEEPTWRAAAIAAAIVGAMPVVGLAVAAFRFSGLPLRSPMPLIDWSIFAAGAVLALGAISILALGVRRAREVTTFPAVIHMQQIRDAQLQLRHALEADYAADSRARGEDEIRVRRV